MRDPHEILGVEPGAAAEIVRRAFKRAVRRYHPDVNPRDAMASEKLRAVVAAYQELERTRIARGPHAATSSAASSRTVVVCQIRGADLYGIASDTGGDWLDLELRAVDACSTCGGQGFEAIASSWWRVERFECEACKGGGIVRIERHLRVRIPRADARVSRLRLRGMGLPRAGLTRGDAILAIRSETRA